MLCFSSSCPRRSYEVNPELVPRLEAAGLRFVGKDDTGTRMEIVELADHPFFVAAQVREGACCAKTLRPRCACC